MWFREEHADWGIETEFLQLGADVAIAKATIKDASGRVIAQGTKSETPGGFPDYIEKAESGAIGRALAMCGYGTQFTLELDEGPRIVDAPTQRALNEQEGPVAATSPAAAPVTSPAAQSAPQSNVELISDKQLKRLFALQKKANLPDTEMKSLAGKLGITTRSAIPKSRYNQLCELVENWKP